MKRLVAVVVFALASVAQAETLLPIVQAEGGDRWVLDNDSIEFVGMTAAWRVYVYPSEGGQRIPKIIAVDVPGCFAGRGELTIYTHVNGSIRP